LFRMLFTLQVAFIWNGFRSTFETHCIIDPYKRWIWKDSNIPKGWEANDGFPVQGAHQRFGITACELERLIENANLKGHDLTVGSDEEEFQIMPKKNMSLF
jgi:hypothetical protein